MSGRRRPRLAASAEGSPAAHLITIFDAAPNAWAHQAFARDRGLTLRAAATAACAFQRAFLLLSRENDVTFLAAKENLSLIHI